MAEVRAEPEALKLLSRDARMRRLVRRFGPYAWGVHGAFPALVRAIIGQQVSNAAARALYRRLVRHVPPVPEALAEAGEETLRALGLSRQKAGYLRAAARFALEGGLDGLEALSDAAVAERLRVLKGVGPWTVDMVLIFGLGRLDVWPVADLGLVRAVREVYGLDRSAVPDLGERFRPYRSAAAWYLWAAVEGG